MLMIFLHPCLPCLQVILIRNNQVTIMTAHRNGAFILIIIYIVDSISVLIVHVAVLFGDIVSFMTAVIQSAFHRHMADVFWLVCCSIVCINNVIQLSNNNDEYASSEHEESPIMATNRNSIHASVRYERA